MLHRHSLLMLLAVASAVAAGKLPSNIKRCARTDPQFNECFRLAVEDALPKMKAGLPKLGVQPLDPLLISEMRLSQGSNSPVNLDLTFTNMSTTKILDGVKIESASFDFDTMELKSRSMTPHVIAVSKYSVKGKILLVPITGTGDGRVDLYDLAADIHIKGKRIKKADGKDYFEVTDVEVKMKPKKMKVIMNNLFNGDKQLGDAMSRVVNQNWELVFNEMSPSLNLAYAHLYKATAGALFLRVPFDDIMPENL